MKRLLKYIGRKVDEKVANSINSVKECINSVNECINTINNTTKDKDGVLNFAMLFGGASLATGFISFCMFIKYKTM